MIRSDRIANAARKVAAARRADRHLT